MMMVLQFLNRIELPEIRKVIAAVVTNLGVGHISQTKANAPNLAQNAFILSPRDCIECALELARI